MERARGYHGAYMKLLLCCLLQVFVYHAVSQSAPLAAASASCTDQYSDDFTIYYFRDSPAGGGNFDLDTIDNIDRDTCEIECTNRCDCGAYAFLNDNSRCILKHSGSNFQKMTRNITLGIRTRVPDSCPGGLADSYEEVQTSMDSPGNDLLSLDSLYQKGCKDLCTHLCSCLGYNFYTEDGVTRCHIKGKVDELIPSRGIDFYVRKTASVAPIPSATTASPPPTPPPTDPSPPLPPPPPPPLTPTSSLPVAPPPTGSKGLGAGKIAGIVIGVLAGIAGGTYAIRLAIQNNNCCNIHVERS